MTRTLYFTSALLLISFTSLAYGWQFTDLFKPPEPDCTYKAWSGWSKCSCGSLTKYRTRSLIDFAPEECDALESEEVPCPQKDCVCEDTRKDCLWTNGKRGGEETGWCENKNNGDPRKSGTWANWLRRFCAKSCDLCAKDGAGPVSATTLAPTTPPNTDTGDGGEEDWDGECKCDDWKIVNECPSISCGLCGREVSERKCNSQANCWTRQEKTCDKTAAQREKCPKNRLDRLRRLKVSGVWERLRDTGCCGTDSPFGPECTPLGAPQG